MWNIEWESTVLRPWLQGIAIVAMAACNRLSNTPSVPPRDAQAEKNKEAEVDVVAPWDGQVAAGPVDALGIASDAGGPAADAPAIAAASPIGNEGAILRVAAERVQGAMHLLRPSLAALAELFGDDPFARKW
jgi:hypothetical protein